MVRSIPKKVAYLVVAWVLMVSYQIFTQSALTTVATSFAVSAPPLAFWINSNTGAAIFVCSFAWMFVLSAIISIVMFGKERKLTMQFMVSLGLTVAGSALLGVLDVVGLDLSNPNVLSQPFTLLFGNVFFAFFYLALPFIFMLAVDLGIMKIRK